MLQTLSIAQVARLLRISPRTLRSAAFRRRAGIPVVRVGGRRIIGVASIDVAAVLERGRERFDDGDAA